MRAPPRLYALAATAGCTRAVRRLQRLQPRAHRLLAGRRGERCHKAIADAKGASYPGWARNTWDCSSDPSLISDFNGTPTGFGVGLRDHLKGLS